jgi:hypothetical protein
METKSRRDGTQYQDYQMDFLSKPICLGDYNILMEKGSDPKNCPVCALAHESTDMAAAPQRRFAIHVVRYKTKQGTTKPAVPFSVELVVWSFTDKTYNKIEEFREEWGDLRQHDIVLNCTNEPFQLYDISISPTAEWMQDEERMKLVKTTFKENQIPDLSIACGSRKEKKWIDEDVQKVRQRWVEISGAQTEAAPPLGDALNGLFSNVQPGSAAATSLGSGAPERGADPEPAPFDSNAVLGLGEPHTASTPSITVPVSTAEKSLDDLLADLGDD